MSRMRAAVPVGLLSLTLLVGCTAEDPAPTPTSPATQPATPTPTPTPTPTGAPDELGVVYDQSDPELGIVFEDVPDDLTGDAADVYNTLALYKVEYWRSLTTNEVSPIIRSLGSSEVIENFEWFTSENSADEAEIGGTFRATISAVMVEGDTATAVTCDDYADATFADKDGEYTPAEANFGDVRRAEVELDRMAEPGQWRVRSTERSGEC